MKPFSIAVLLLALTASVPRASAQSSDPRSAAADASGRAHFQRGQRLSTRGDYAAAYREFAAGYAVTRRPLFLFNMGEAARASGDVAKARESYLEFLRIDPNSPLAATAQGRLAELDGRPSASTPASSAEPRPAPLSSKAGAARASDGAGASSPPAISTAPSARPEVPLLPPSAVPPRPPAASVIVRAPPEPVATVREEESAPLWKKWPFWAVVGGAIAGGVAVYAVTRSGTPCGAGCSEINFR